MATVTPATMPPIPNALPDGFVSPFTRVEMEPNARIDDGLACVAMLTSQPLAKIKNFAVELGLPQHGPAWVYPDLLCKILRQFDLIAEDDKEATSLAALPDVAIIAANYDKTTEYGRWVLWHHVGGTATRQAFSYVHDPAYWIDPTLKTTRDVKRLITPGSPIYYIHVNRAPNAPIKFK